MALRDRTRQLFADTLKDMMKQMPLEKVRVGELCRLCGAERRSFYYHFRDKYDLVAWIYLQDYHASVPKTAGGYTLEQHIVQMLRRMRDKEQFYRKAFSDSSQNSIEQYIYEKFVEQGEEIVRSYTGNSSLSQNDLYDIKSYSFACIGHTREWLNGKSEYSPEEFAHQQYRSMPDILRNAYESITDPEDLFSGKEKSVSVNSPADE